MNRSITVKHVPKSKNYDVNAYIGRGGQRPHILISTLEGRE